MKSLVLISHPGSANQDRRILEIAEWMGVPTRQCTIVDRVAIDRLTNDLGCKVCAAISIESLTFLRELISPAALREFIRRSCVELLVYSVGPRTQYNDTISWITNGAVSGLAPAARRSTFRLPGSGRQFCSVFAGQEFAVRRPTSLSTFEIDSVDDSRVEMLLLADDRPMFLRMKQGPCELCLLSLAELPDIHKHLSHDRSIEEYYDQIIPLLIFLRHCFGETCWQGIASSAQLIIDDPLIDQRYGFLDYRALRNSIRSAGYGASIAFIPWNHWRTSRERAARIFAPGTNLSICVHGCDHTNREFDETSAVSLLWKAKTALRRMERHRSRTGLPFDRVMVFPQGRFSTSALLALRTSSYLAAVNTTCFPSNADAASLTIADFLRPAITKFHGFPLFQRRYPRRLVDFAFDVFLGKPVLIVQHHDDFQYGYKQLESFLADLNGLGPKLSWRGLSDIVTHCCAVRALCEKSMEVRFFTREFRFKNVQSDRTDFTFSKAEPDASSISNVMVDGNNVQFFLGNGLLTFEQQVSPGRTIEVRIFERPELGQPVPKWLGLKHAVSVPVRRMLSEFRDNTIIKYPRLFAASRKVARRLKVTGDGGAEERP